MSAPPARTRLGLVGGSPDAAFADGLDLPPWNRRVSLRVYRGERPLVADLDAGRLDLAALSATRLLERCGPLELVPGLAVTSDGSSGIARLVGDVPLDEVRRVTASDPSGTAATLAKLLFAESGVAVELLPRAGTGTDSTRDGHDVAHLVLDDGTRTAPGGDENADSSREPAVDVDLGAAWTALTSLPFVWSAWVVRRGRLERGTYAILHSARTRGRRRVETADGGTASRLVARLGRREIDGLRLFRGRCAAHGVLRVADDPALARLSAVDACRTAADRLRGGGPPR